MASIIQDPTRDPDPTEPPGVPASKSFPNPAFAIIGRKGADITVQVAQRTNPNAGAQPVKSFGTEPTDAWTFGANTMAVNLVALADLARFLEKEAQHLGKPVWLGNIQDLIGKLDAAVETTGKLCKDTNTTLSAPKSS